jgi:hypothetical protein
MPAIARECRLARIPMIWNQLSASWPGLSPQVGSPDLRHLMSADLGQPEVRCHPRLAFPRPRRKTWMPGTADKFTQSAQA